MRWFDIPRRFVDMYARNVVRIEAMESLRLVNAIMVGNGMLDKETATDVLDSWQRRAEGRPSEEEELTDMDWLRQLQMLGINVHIVGGD